MKNKKYLTQNLKIYYLEELEKVKNCFSHYWDLDPGMNEVLDKINKNPNIQSLFSKRCSLEKLKEDKNLGINNPDELYTSYFIFAFTENIKSSLGQETFPFFNEKYQSYNIIIVFEHPEEFVGDDNPSAEIQNLGCVMHKNYFNINKCVIWLKTKKVKIHNELWNDITEKLSMFGK